MDNFTFRQYLKESGYDKMTYQEEVYTTCLGLGNYQNIDLYYQDEIDEAYEQNVPVNELAAKLCAQYDKDYGTPKPEEIPEFEEEEYSQETLDAMADYPQDEFNEATETEETFEDWKGYVFKYLDKRVDVNKIKDLGTYIKDFVKQEYDNGEPSWFMCAESIVNYARIKYPDALKNRESNAFNITESSNSQVYVVTFETEDEASEQEYELRDNCGSIVDTALDGNKVYIIPNNRAGLTIIKEWFGENATLADNADEIVDTYFNMNESVRSLKTYEFLGWVEFKTENGAYDAFTAWKKMKQYRTYEKVDVDKSENKLFIAAPSKKLVKMTQEWLSEVDEDAVDSISSIH